MKTIDIYGTLGPSLHTREALYKMLCMGMNGVRLNLSHVDLPDCREWLDAFHQAQEQAGIQAKLLIEMKGPELRIGKLKEPVLLKEGQKIELGKEIPVPVQLLSHVKEQEQLLLDDGRLLLEVAQVREDTLLCTVLHGGVLKSGKSVALVNGHIALPTLTESDIRNLKVAKQYGVTGIMQPFVRHAQDLITVKGTLSSIGCPQLQVYAKIENMEGVTHLKELLPHCDYILIMSVFPGFAGQSFIQSIDAKIRELISRKQEYGYRIVLDGACSAEVIQRYHALGVDGFVLGTSALFQGEGSYADNMKRLRSLQ